MPFSRPTLPALIDQAATDAAVRLADGAPLLPVSNAAVLARVLAGAVHGLYGYLDWIARQLLPDTCDVDLLERHAQLWGLVRSPASYAAGTVAVTGTSGTIVPAETRWRRADGAEYAAASSVTLVDGAAVVPVTALVAGAGGNATAETALTLIGAVGGLVAAAMVGPAGMTAGNDAEGDEALRARVLLRLQAPPQGGCAGDYVAWALAAHPAITRAWVFPLEAGAGSVTVRVMTDGASVDGLPSPEVISAVAAAIAPLRPVTARVVVAAPVAAPLHLRLAPSPDTAMVRAAIIAAVRDLLRREAVPGGRLLLSHLREAISTAPGEFDYEMASPAADVQAAPGYITTFGSVVWSAS